MNRSIVWLASYPKSGNTWFRSFITAIQKKDSFSINEMETDGIFSGKNILESTLDLESEWLTDKQIFEYQSLAWNFIAQNAKNELLIKIHDAIQSKNGKLNIPVESSAKAIYFIRHPFDIVPSLMNHAGFSIQESVDFICEEEAFFVKKNQDSNQQFRQNLFTWAMHVESWQRLKDFPVLFLRYEDMLANSFETFKKAVEFLGWEFTDEEIKAAIIACSFENLKKQEEENGFKEKSSRSKRFFNVGKSGYGKGLLTELQKEKIIEINGQVMAQFDYK